MLLEVIQTKATEEVARNALLVCRSNINDMGNNNGGVTKADQKKAINSLKKLSDSFDVSIRTSHFEDSNQIQNEALSLIRENPGIDWSIYFVSLFNGNYAAKGLFGYHGLIVASLYANEEKLELIEETKDFITQGNQVSASAVLKQARMFDQVREVLSKHEALSYKELRKICREENIGSPDSRVSWLERNRELSIEGDFVLSTKDSVKKRVSGVPQFSEYYSTYSKMNSEQKDYFDNVFKPAFIGGQEIDIGNNWSYVFVLLHEMIRDRDIYKDELPQALRKAIQISKFSSTLETYARNWLADLRFIDGDFDGGFEILNEVFPQPNLVVARSIMIPEHRLQVRELLALTQGDDGLATVGKKHLEKVSIFAQRSLDEFHRKNGKSLVADLWTRIHQHVVEKTDLAWEVDEGSPFIQKEQVIELLKGSTSLYQPEPPIEIFFGVAGARPTKLRWPSAFPELGYEGIREVVAARLRAELRSAENALRDDIGVPRVGEGWVSEMQLLHELRSAFSDVRIQHQARLAWLGQQSLDIYLPDFNIGIEYQGAQHSRSVEFFGGEETYTAQKERDARKRAKCDSNGCILIEVFPGYSLDEIVSQVKDAIASRT